MTLPLVGERDAPKITRGGDSTHPSSGDAKTGGMHRKEVYMLKADILAVFETAGVVVPDFVREQLGDELYDDIQDWCCGFNATRTDDGVVIVDKYCLKDRVDPCSWLVRKDGSYEEIPSEEEIVDDGSDSDGYPDTDFDSEARNG